MIVDLFIFTGVVLITYLFFNYKERVHYFRSFKRRGIPGPEPSIWWGNFWHFKANKNKNLTIEKWAKQYGEIFGFYLGRKRFIILTNLDMINQIFIKNVKKFFNREDFPIDAKYIEESLIALKNERWTKLRKILSPTFSYTKVHSGIFDSEIRNCILEFNKEIIRKINEGNLIDLKGEKSAEIEVYDLTQALTLDVITRTSYGLKERVYEPNNHLKRIAKEYILFAGNIFFEISLLIPFMKKILTFCNNHLTSGRLIDMMCAKLKEHINLFLKKHQNTDQDRTELNDDNKFSKNEAKMLTSLIKNLADKSITENEFIGNILLILLAGYETTSNSLTAALYLLAKHPSTQEKLREETKKDGLESKYLDCFWHENLRLYPTVTFFINRQASQDCIINGIQFLKGDIIQAPVWLINHDPNYWPEPYEFKPERFEPEARKKHHPSQFLTYGIGHKICLGLNFANYESKLFLINVLKEFKIETCKDTPNPLEFITPTVVNNPSKPVILKFSKINQ